MIVSVVCLHRSHRKQAIIPHPGSAVEAAKALGMQQPGVPSPLSLSRRRIVVASHRCRDRDPRGVRHDGTIASRWTNGLGLLLGGLAGTYIGEQLERFGGRVAVTRIAWLQMAAIALLLVAIISGANCRRTVSCRSALRWGSRWGRRRSTFSACGCGRRDWGCPSTTRLRAPLGVTGRFLGRLRCRGRRGCRRRSR